VNSKQRAFNAFNHEPNDKIPMCLFLGGSWQIAYSGNTYKTLIKAPERAAQIFAESSEEFDADIVTAGTGATALFIKALGGGVEYNKQGFPVILTEPLVSKDDLKRISPDMVIADPDVHSLVETAGYMAKIFNGDRMLLGNGRGPFTLAGQLFGLENFSRALYKDTGFAEELLNFTTEVALSYFKAMIREGNADGIVIADPTSSGDIISKKHFNRFALPYLKKIVDEMKKQSKPVMLHICGNIADRLEDLADIGISCLSVDTKMDLSFVKKTVGDRICIAGNADPVEAFKFGTPQKIMREAERCIEQGGNRGFVLMPGCDLAPGLPYENIKAFANANRANYAMAE
jgi:uroporphyrinogen decarboxylase